MKALKKCKKLITATSNELHTLMVAMHLLGRENVKKKKPTQVLIYTEEEAR